jgi:hypothetical protein
MWDRLTEEVEEEFNRFQFKEILWYWLRVIEVINWREERYKATHIANQKVQAAKRKAERLAKKRERQAAKAALPFSCQVCSGQFFQTPGATRKRKRCEKCRYIFKEKPTP